MHVSSRNSTRIELTVLSKQRSMADGRLKLCESVFSIHCLTLALEDISSSDIIISSSPYVLLPLLVNQRRKDGKAGENDYGECNTELLSAAHSARGLLRGTSRVQILAITADVV